MLERYDAGDVVAKDEEHNAKLCISRAQYTLVVDGPGVYETRHWSRRKVNGIEDAMQRAQKSLDKILAKPASA